MTAAILNLSHPANTVHWHFFSMSVANVVVILLMLIVFAVAIVAPFPGHGVKEPKKCADRPDGAGPAPSVSGR